MSTLVSMLLAAIFQMTPVGPIPISENAAPCSQKVICKNAIIQLEPSHLISKEELMEHFHSEKG